MHLMRRFSAALFAAPVILLAACGGEMSNPASNEELVAAVDPTNLEFTLNTRELFFSYNVDTRTLTPMTDDSDEFFVSGVIASASIANFGTPRLITTGAVPATATGPAPFISTRREFVNGGWRITVLPEVFFVPQGFYTFESTITVPGSRNNFNDLALRGSEKVRITILSCNTATCLNAIGAGSRTISSLGVGDGSWNRGNTLNNVGAYFFEDRTIFVGANQTITIDLQGRDCGTGLTLPDPYIYVFLGGAFVTSDDDAGCGFNASATFTNGTPFTTQYLLRATSFSTGEIGSYRITIRNGTPGPLP